MKRFLIAAIFGIVCMSLNAQSFAKGHPELYLGKTIVVVDKDYRAPLGYRNFYSAYNKQTNTFRDDDRLFPTSSSKKYSKVEKLLGTQWEVKQVYKTSKTTLRGAQIYALELNSGKKTIFYEYDSESDLHLEFDVIGGIEKPADFYCEDFTVTKDKFSGMTAYTSKPISGFTVSKGTKVIDGQTYSVIQLHKNTVGRTCEVGKKGFIMLLENGDRIEKPEAEIEVQVNPTGSAYVYSVDIPLTDEDLQKLSQFKVTDTKTYIFTSEVKDGDILMEYIKCLMKD